MKIVEICGLDVRCFGSVNDAASEIISEDGEVLNSIAVALNAEKLITARNDKKTMDVLKKSDFLYADGVPIVWTINKKTNDNSTSRIPGCDLWECLMSRAAILNKSVYLLGGRAEVLEEVEKKLKLKFGLKLVGRRDGYFENEQEIISDIVQLKPELICVAMGSPKQEVLMERLRKEHPLAFYMGVGGTFDVFAGRVKRAPLVFQRLNLEWFYRLAKEPKRIIRQLKYFEYMYLHWRGLL